VVSRLVTKDLVLVALGVSNFVYSGSDGDMWCIFAGVGRCRRRPGICSLAGVVGGMRQNPYLRDNLPGMGSRDNQPGGVSPPLDLAQSPLEVLSPPLESMWGCGQRGEYAVCCVVRVLLPLVVLPPQFV